MPLGIVHSDCREKNGIPLYASFSFFWYAGVAGKLVRGAKYKKDTRCLGALCAAISSSARAQLLTLHKLIKGSVITYIPLDQSTRETRGFNQSQWLAHYISTILNVPCVELLQKIRPSHRPQASLLREKRRGYMRGLFHCAGAVPQQLYVVDDVITSGATMREAARALTEGGARRMCAISACTS